MSTRRLVRVVRDWGAESWRSMVAAGISQYGLRTGCLSGEIMALALHGPQLQIPTHKGAIQERLGGSVTPRGGGGSPDVS